MTDRQNWFLSRIGKRVYRNRNGCSCKSCENVYHNGLVIRDEEHAHYLYDTEWCFKPPVKYFETREEVTAFENKLG